MLCPVTSMYSKICLQGSFPVCIDSKVAALAASGFQGFPQVSAFILL